MASEFSQVAQSREEIFQELLRYKKTIFFVCLGFSSDFAQAEELTQDIFLKAWEKIGSIKHGLNLKGWFFTLAKNRCLDHARREKIRKLFMIDHLPDNLNLPDDSQDSPEERLMVNEQKIRLKKAIQYLPKTLQQVFIFKEYAGWSCEEISALFNIKLGTVYSRVNRAKSRILKKMRGDS